MCAGGIALWVTRNDTEGGHCEEQRDEAISACQNLCGKPLNRTTEDSHTSTCDLVAVACAMRAKKAEGKTDVRTAHATPSVPMSYVSI